MRRLALLALSAVTAIACPCSIAPASGTPAPTSNAPATGAPVPAWSGLHQCTEPSTAAYLCGVLSVPLDRGPQRDPADTRTVALEVLVGGNPEAGRTLLLLTGGPGQPGPVLAPRVLPRLSRILADYRVVFLDQRGTGAGALDCPMLQAERGSSDLTVPSVGAVRECADVLGDDREFYATTDSVADFEDLRRALGVERWAVDGVSYGTYTGQRYAAAHPDRVTHLVLDSVVPVHGFDATLWRIFPEYARVMRDVCAAPGRDCPGDPAEDLAAVLRQRPDLGPRLLNAVTGVSYFDPAGHFDLPERLHAGAGGDLAPVLELLDLVEEDDTPAQLYSQGIQASTLCQDLAFPWGGAQSPEVSRAQLADEATGRLTNAQVWPFNREAARGNGEMVMCEHWPTVTDQVVPASQLQLDGVRTLILAGERDLGTPLVWAQEAHRDIPGSTLVVVPDQGHGIQGRAGAAVDEQVASFLLS